MKYQYITATGTKTIEIPKEWGNILKEFDKEEHALEERERYHKAFSIDAFSQENDISSKTNDPLHILEQHEMRSQIEMCLEKLTETQRRRFLMYAEGLSLAEISRIEGVVFNAVKTSINAAKREILKNLSKK